MPDDGQFFEVTQPDDGGEDFSGQIEALTKQVTDLAGQVSDLKSKATMEDGKKDLEAKPEDTAPKFEELNRKLAELAAKINQNAGEDAKLKAEAFRLDKKLDTTFRVVKDIEPHIFGDNQGLGAGGRVLWGKATADWAGGNTVTLTPVRSRTDGTATGAADVTAYIVSPSDAEPSDAEIFEDTILAYLPIPNETNKGVLLPVLYDGSDELVLVTLETDGGTGAVGDYYTYIVKNRRTSVTISTGEVPVFQPFDDIAQKDPGVVGVWCQNDPDVDSGVLLFANETWFTGPCAP